MEIHTSKGRKKRDGKRLTETAETMETMEMHTSKGRRETVRD